MVSRSNRSSPPILSPVRHTLLRRLTPTDGEDQLRRGSTPELCFPGDRWLPTNGWRLVLAVNVGRRWIGVTRSGERFSHPSHPDMALENAGVNGWIEPKRGPLPTGVLAMPQWRGSAVARVRPNPDGEGRSPLADSVAGKPLGDGRSRSHWPAMPGLGCLARSGCRG